ncbi:hypothetical protein EON63_03295 [archaeon]|nr:MAG: hypothetical protein EON63_03295 [archaeon]
MLGERPVVRQSRLYRQHEGGNSMKALLGADNLAWEADKQQGVFQGRPVYDHNTADPYARNQASNRGSSMGMYTNSDFHSTYETTSGGYGHGSTVSSTTVREVYFFSVHICSNVDDIMKIP